MQSLVFCLQLARTMFIWHLVSQWCTTSGLSALIVIARERERQSFLKTVEKESGPRQSPWYTTSKQQPFERQM